MFRACLYRYIYIYVCIYEVLSRLYRDIRSMGMAKENGTTAYLAFLFYIITHCSLRKWGA